MDFAENYTCSNVSEIQSAYWNPVMVTLHPVVAYFRNPNDENEISHKSFVYISDELGHTCSTVYAFLKDLVPRLKELIPELSCIHYLSDSPTSQYRNKSIFHIIANHLQLFGVKGSWQYFEAGHGKGPCDGVGAVAKRMADEAVRQGRVTIQDASDYFAWASGTQGAVKYVFVSKEQCEETQNAMKTVKLSPVKETIKIHCVFGLNENKIACRNASCFCENCYKDGLFSGQCDGWEYHTIGVEQVQSNENGNVAVEDAVNSDEQEPVLNNVDLRLDDIVVDQYVAAMYDSNWFIGKVLDIDRDDGDVNISFMERLKTKGEQSELKYKWPNSSDELWVQFEDIVCVVNEPTPIGSSKRGYQISVDDLNNIKEKVSEKTL